MVQRVERLVEALERGVHQRASHVRGAVGRPLANRLRELGLGVSEPVLEHVQPVRAIAAELGSQPAGVNGALVCFEKLGVDVARGAHAERREHQVARGHAFPCPEVRAALAGRALEAVDGAIGALTRAAVPVVPAGANQFLGRGNLEAVADLGTMGDPATVFAEALPHLADRDVHRVTRHERAVPGFRHHLFVADGLAAVTQQRAQGLKGLWPQLDVHTVAREARRRGVEQKGSEADFRHGRLHAWRSGNLPSFCLPVK